MSNKIVGYCLMAKGTCMENRSDSLYFIGTLLSLSRFQLASIRCSHHPTDSNGGKSLFTSYASGFGKV